MKMKFLITNRKKRGICSKYWQYLFDWWQYLFEILTISSSSFQLVAKNHFNVYALKIIKILTISVRKFSMINFLSSFDSFLLCFFKKNTHTKIWSQEKGDFLIWYIRSPVDVRSVGFVQIEIKVKRLKLCSAC
jgi:hypothetical protein